MLVGCIHAKAAFTPPRRVTDLCLYVNTHCYNDLNNKADGSIPDAVKKAGSAK